jgi:putative flavoprotein involved in K+ transport
MERLALRRVAGGRADSTASRPTLGIRVAPRPVLIARWCSERCRHGYREGVARHQVVIVGAGPAGLAAAAGLRRSGFDPLLIERFATIGSAWRTRYDNFRLHTIRWLSGLPGMPIPSTCGAWVGRDDFVGYLESYAHRFELSPQFHTELERLAPAADGWVMTTSQGHVETRRVVLATGAYTEPHIPAWAGRESFGPPMLHSSAYRNAEPYAGSRVLVVGSGNSATEVANDLAASGNVTVEMAVRTPPSIVRRDLRGVPTQPLGIALRNAPASVGDPLSAALRRLTIPDLSAQGLPAPNAPFSQFQQTGTLPVLDHGFVSAVRDGTIRIRTGVSSLDSDSVVHSDGSRSRPDAVIAATGYRPGLRAVLGPLTLIDDHGLPTIGSRGGVGVAPGLFTVGITITLSGLLREISKDSTRLVHSIGNPAD